MMFDFDAYDAIAIAAGQHEPPPEYAVHDVPWIAHSKAYCQSTSLQMIAQWRSRELRPLGFYNWLMGFTYGAGHLRGSLVFLPFADPEAGLRFASPYLGLEHRYFITDDEQTYVRAAKTVLAEDRPIRVMLDSATLKGCSDYFSPHSIVITGYAGDLACVYETRTEDKHEYGSSGQQVPWSTILSAAQKVSQVYRYPWKFQYTRFEPVVPTPLDEPAICARNAAQLSGRDCAYAPTGALALHSLARELERAEQFGDLTVFLEYGVYTRADNAAYLRETYAERPNVARAASCLADASERYARAVRALAGQSSGIGRELSEAGALEAETSALLAAEAGGLPMPTRVREDHG